MAAYLMRWLNSSGIGENISCLETQLSNGYVIAKLLLTNKVIRKDEFNKFLNSQELESRVYNYKLLDAHLMRTGVKYNPKIIGRIINEERGAITKLLFSIKCKLQPEIAPSMNTFDSAVISSGEGFTDGKVELQRMPVNSKSSDLAFRGKLTQKQLKEVLRERDFEKVRIENEQRCDELQKNELEEIKKLKTEIRRERIDNFRQGRILFDEQMENNQNSWKQQQEKFIEMERRDLVFELTMREQQRIYIQNERVDATNDMRTSIYAFERNLKRQGIDVTDYSPAVSEKKSEWKHIQNNQTLAERAEMAIAATKTEVAAYLKRIKQDQRKSVRAKKEREQRQRKIYVDQKQTQISAEETDRMKLMLASIDKDARDERNAAAKRRRMRHLGRKKLNISRALTRRCIMQRDVDFRKQVAADNERCKKINTEYFASKEYNQIAESRKTTANNKRQRKREKSLAICSKTLDLIIEGAMILSEKRPIPHCSWQRYKQKIINGSLAWECGPGENNQRKVQPVKSDEKTGLDPDAEFHDVQNYFDIWISENVENHFFDQTSVANIQDTLSILCKGAELIPKVKNPLPGLKLCIVGPSGSGKTSVAVRLKHRLGIDIIQPTQLMEEAKAFYEENESTIELDNSSESVAFDTFSQSLFDLGKIVKASDSEINEAAVWDSIELAKVVSLYTIKLGNEWIIDGFPRTQRQALMLEYTLTLHEPHNEASDIVPKQNFVDYCKAQEKLDADCRRFSPSYVFQVALHRYWNHPINESSLESEYTSWDGSNIWLNEWSQEHIIKFEGLKTHTNEGEHLDAEHANDTKGSKDTNKDESKIEGLKIDVNTGRAKLLDDVLQRVQDITNHTIPVCQDKGIELYRNHLEAIDPFGSGQVVDLKKAQELNKSFGDMHDQYATSCKAVVQKINKIFHEADKESDQAIEAGKSLILGEDVCETSATSKLEETLDKYWNTIVVKRLNDFKQKFDATRKKSRSLRAYDGESKNEKMALIFETTHWIKHTENALYEKIISTGKVVQNIINDWRSKYTASNCIDELMINLINFLDAEQAYYCSLREVVKEYFASLEQPFAVDKNELVQATTFYEREIFTGTTERQKELVSRLMRGKQVVEMRRSRGENHMNPNPDSLGKTLIELNEYFYSKICLIESTALRQTSKLLRKYDDAFRTLEEIQSKHMTNEINRINKKAKDMTNKLLVWKTQSTKEFTN